ncbi:MAG: polyprenyl synthetase family protein, partial [Proteobacteria bacterium]|nr:polyprenyl synthetase family protein [Pseudomonadota bacterium]
AERVPQIDRALEARFQDAAGLPPRLRDAMRHLLFPGGKRLRPVFALAAAEAVGGRAAVAMPIAVAVELVHTYSLIHDDLPCMDDDALRRGRPTVHIAYDEATAVLAGDALLAEAFAALTASAAERAEAEAALFAVRTLAEAAGAAGLVGGQVDDLLFSSESESESETQGTDYARLASIHSRKTAALFQAAILGGAALAGASESERTTLDAFARDVGIAFQIADDLLDADSEEAASILRVQGIEDAKQDAEGLLDRALLRIEDLCERAEPLRELARFAVRRKR